VITVHCTLFNLSSFLFGKGHESTDSWVFSDGGLGGHQSAVSGEGIQVQVQVKSQEQVQVMKKITH